MTAIWVILAAFALAMVVIAAWTSPTCWPRPHHWVNGQDEGYAYKCRRCHAHKG